MGFKNTKKNIDVKNVEDIVFEQNFNCGSNKLCYGFLKPKSKIYYCSDCGHDHSHKKGKDSLETRVVLLMFSPEPEISRVTVQSVHQNREKWRLL